MSSINNKNRGQEPPLLLKIVFVGDSGVGKTSLLTRQASNEFTEQHLATIGVDFRVKQYDLGLLKVKAQMWDTAGQERFRSIQKPYYKNAKAVCVCFALNDRKSFENLSHWMKEIEEMEVPKQCTILIGCKSDLDVEVPTDEIILFAEKHQLTYHQTSSKQNEGVNQAFRNIMISCAERQIHKLRNLPLDERQAIGGNLKNQNVKPKKTTCC